MMVVQNALGLAETMLDADALGLLTPIETRRAAEARTPPTAPRARTDKKLVRTFNVTPSTGAGGPSPLAVQRMASYVVRYGHFLPDQTMGDTSTHHQFLDRGERSF
jgi:hypothetical protein